MTEGTDRRGRLLRALACTLPVLLVVWQGWHLLRGPIPAVLDGAVPDDAFYYLVPAQHIARTGVSTFDGIHFTNGYHPLWMAFCVVVAWFFPAGGDAGFRAIQVVQLLLAAAAVALVARTLVRAAGAVIGGVAALYFVTRLEGPLMDGLETPLVLLFFAAVAGRLLDGRLRARDDAPPIRPLVVSGVLVGLLFLARTDQSFTVAACAAWFAAPALVRARREGSPLPIAQGVAFLGPIALLGGGYLALNLLLTGHLMPVSGAAKVFYSDAARAQALAEGRTLLSGIASNVLGHPRIVLVGFAGPWLLLAVRPFVKALRDDETLVRLAPAFAGLTASFAFYNLAFWPPYAYAPWYYVPHKFAAAIAFAVAAKAAWAVVAARAPGTSGWLAAPARSAFAGTAALLTSAVLLCAATVRGFEQWSAPKPGGWNSALYRTAHWAREGVPASATIWAASAGILGYFSGHPVVNVDGLANDYAFLEKVLKGPPGAQSDYRSQWDYGIDAFVDADLSVVERLGWKDVTPPDVAVDVRDGREMRHIRVFRMPSATR